MKNKPIPMQPRRGDIFMADLTKMEPVCGIRPVLIVQNNKGNYHSSSVIAVLVTSQKKKYMPTHVKLFRDCGLKKPSIAVCEHIVTLEKDMLLSYVGSIGSDTKRWLDHALSVSLGLSPEGRGPGGPRESR